ncbi:MAG: LURP-one-related family protein [Promethearchaeota archaeon]
MRTIPFCKECGSEIKDLTQNFCEKCGSAIPDSVKQAGTAPTPARSAPIRSSAQKSYYAAGSLFDINRNYYILKEKYWDWGSGDILDENNQIIGRMKRVILSIRRRVELQEVDGTIAATIHTKIISARGAQDLKDPQGNLIARIKKKILSFFRPVFYLEDPEGNQWFRAQGKFMGFSFKVYDTTTGNVVAEIEKADRWRDLFLGGLLDFKDTYALRILDNETDRRILVGFVLSIDNVLHDY